MWVAKLVQFTKDTHETHSVLVSVTQLTSEFFHWPIWSLFVVHSVKLFLNLAVKFPSFPEVFPHVCVLPPARPPSFAQLYEAKFLRRKEYTRSNIFLPASKSCDRVISAVRPAFSFNRALHLSCSNLSPESENGRREVGSTIESGALPRAVSISEVACGGERGGGGGGEEAAWANEDNQEVSEASLEKLEYISQSFQCIFINLHVS